VTVILDPLDPHQALVDGVPWRLVCREPGCTPHTCLYRWEIADGDRLAVGIHPDARLRMPWRSLAVAAAGLALWGAAVVAAVRWAAS
jgi:predicted small integral membrane protein